MRRCFFGTRDPNRELASAIAAGRAKAVERVLARAGPGLDLTLEDDDGVLPLTAAVKATDPGIAAALLQHGAPSRARDDEALVTASRRGRVRAVRLLLDNGADVHARGERPLLEAARFGHANVVALLLVHGAVPLPGIVREASGNAQSIAIVQLLVSFGARSPADELGEALRDAQMMHDHRRVRDLVRLGADPRIESDRAGKARCMAIATGDVQLLRLLMEHDR